MKNLWKRIFGKRVPSDQERHEYRIILEYCFIPRLVSGIHMRKLGIAELKRTDTWPMFLKKAFTRKFYLEWDELSYKEIIIDKSHTILLYTFPKPISIPEAAYGAVLINTEKKIASYYTLELSNNNEWIIGCQTTEYHFNMGSLENPTEENFIEWVSNKAVLF